jgi:hypothetical protein
MRPLGKIITAQDKKMRLPWWMMVCIFFGLMPVVLLFDHYGEWLLRALPFTRLG